MPQPPSAQRTVALTVMALAVATALAILGVIRKDIAYFFADRQPVALGNTLELSAARLDHGVGPNRYVRLSGQPMGAAMVRFRTGVTGEAQLLFPIAGQREVFVQLAAKDAATAMAAREFTGRLVRFSDLGGRLREPRRLVQARLEHPVPPEAYVLVHGEVPGGAIWPLLLALGCLLFAAVDTWLILRWFRPLPVADEANEPESNEPLEPTTPF